MTFMQNFVINVSALFYNANQIMIPLYKYVRYTKYNKINRLIKLALPSKSIYVHTFIEIFILFLYYFNIVFLQFFLIKGKYIILPQMVINCAKNLRASVIIIIIIIIEKIIIMIFIDIK